MKRSQTKKLPINKLKKKAWRLFSIHIRESSADWRGNVQCYTCGKTLPWKKAHAGHFKHGKLDYDPRNVHVQCVGCNLYGRGRLDVYAMKLVDEYGADILKDLERDSEKIYTYEELEDIIKKYGKK